MLKWRISERLELVERGLQRWQADPQNCRESSSPAGNALFRARRFRWLNEKLMGAELIAHERHDRATRWCYRCGARTPRHSGLRRFIRDAPRGASLDAPLAGGRDRDEPSQATAAKHGLVPRLCGWCENLRKPTIAHLSSALIVSAPSEPIQSSRRFVSRLTSLRLLKGWKVRLPLALPFIRSRLLARRRSGPIGR